MGLTAFVSGLEKTISIGVTTATYRIVILRLVTLSPTRRSYGTTIKSDGSPISPSFITSLSGERLISRRMANGPLGSRHLERISGPMPKVGRI